VRLLDANGTEVRRLVVPNQGTWTVDNNGMVTFTANPGYTGTPTPVRYIVHGNTPGVSAIGTIRIEGECVCEAYESSIPSMGITSSILLLILTMLFSVLFFRKEEYGSIK